MTDPNYLQFARLNESDLARAVAIDAGAPVATGRMGILHNCPSYTIAGLPTVIWEYLQTSYANDVCWACYDSRRDDPKSGPVGYGATVDQSLVRFLEQYADTVDGPWHAQEEAP